MGSGRLGSGSLAAIFPPCNRLSRESFGPPIWSLSDVDTTGTAVGRPFVSSSCFRPVSDRPCSCGGRQMAYDRYDPRDAPR